MCSIFNFLFCTSSSAEEITDIKNNIKRKPRYLKQPAVKTFNFVNLIYAETSKNRLLLKSLQKDIVSDKKVLYIIFLKNL